MSKKLKAVESNIQPNHKEAELWVTSTNNDGSKEVKYWNSKAQSWSKCEGEGNGGDVEAAAEYYRIDWDKARELGYIDDTDVDATFLTCLSIFDTYKTIMGRWYQINSGIGIVFANIINGNLPSLIVLPTIINSVSFISKQYISHMNNDDNVNEYVTSYTRILELNGLTDVDAIKSCFIPITKEEFYALP